MTNDKRSIREAFERTVDRPEAMIYWDGDSKQYLPKTSLYDDGHQQHSMAKRAAYFLTQRLNDFAAGVQWQSQQAQGEVIGWATRCTRESTKGNIGSWLHSSKESAESFDETAFAGGPANSEIFPVYEHPPAPVAVPGPKTWHHSTGANGHSYCKGWNECREAMLAATPTDKDHQQAALFRAHNGGED